MLFTLSNKCLNHSKVALQKAYIALPLWNINRYFSSFRYNFASVSRFQEKEKRGEMITINENIKW
jgi:hypothetical protein